MKKILNKLKICGIVFAAVAGLIFLLMLSNWNMLRPYLNRKVSESTGREFAIDGNLNVKLRHGLDNETGWKRYIPRPYISAENIHISNPSWSTVGPQMASAKRVEVGFNILPLISKNFVITDLRLVGPQLALQQRKDGTNSWTLKNNGPSPWKIDIQRVAFSEGNLRYLNEAIGLDLRADAKSITSSVRPAGHGVQPYGMEFALGGKFRSAPVTGGGKAGAVLTLTGWNEAFPIEANADISGNKIDLSGTLSDPRSPSGMDLRMKLAGPNMAELDPLTGVLLPNTPPYETQGHLRGKKDGVQWTFTYDKFSGKIGASDIEGTLVYTQRNTRPLLRGRLTSQQLRLADLGPTVGANTGYRTKQGGKIKAPPAGRALPVSQFDATRWAALDADVQFSGKRIVRTGNIPLENIVANVHMKDKVLKLTPLEFGMAGGRITTDISLDGRTKTIDAQARLAARHLKIRELFPKLQSMKASFGEINGDAALLGRGNSVASMLASSNGDLHAVVTEGSVSKFILEIAGLNVANAVAAKLFGDKQVHMNCLAVASTVRNGRASIQRFVLDTDDAVIDVAGYVDLAQEQLNLDVRPKTKGTRIFTLRTPLYAKGTFANPDVGPYKTPIAIKAGAAIVLATVSPLAAILPLVNVSKVPDTDCATAIAEAARPPGTQSVNSKAPTKK